MIMRHSLVINCEKYIEQTQQLLVIFILINNLNLNIMFNTTVINQSRTSYVPYEKTVTVTENRATTDESVRLLNEFQEKAKENIIKTILIQDNILNAIIVLYRDSYVENRLEFHIKFKLNNKEYFTKNYIDKFDFQQETLMKSWDRDSRLEKVKETLTNLFAQAFSEQILTQSNVLYQLNQ